MFFCFLVVANLFFLAAPVVDDLNFLLSLLLLLLLILSFFVDTRVFVTTVDVVDFAVAF